MTQSKGVKAREIKGTLDMTRKERILRMVQGLADDVTYEKVMYNLSVMAAVEEGTAQADRGEGTEHDELFRQLEAEWRELESTGRPGRKKTSVKSTAASPKMPRGGQRPSKSA